MRPESTIRVVLPGDLAGGTLLERATLEEVPETSALSEWLRQRGVDTTSWGEGNRKDVGALWKELDADECGLELWRKADGTTQAVRVVHVLRAKVCTRQSFTRGIFLFNTWQQYGDGRKRIRNGLLSEKVGMSEMPIEANLHEICERAIAEELMQITDSGLRLSPGASMPTPDASSPSQVKVLDEHFVDHTIELEDSKSYPGLLTMYNLYTVEIVCSGLPSVEFNSLEFKPTNAKGERPVKYLHAWAWLQWGDIQRYLLEGSKMKERKTSGSFSNAATLNKWLKDLDVNTGLWDTAMSRRSVQDLFWEVEHGKAQLEMWGRHDGVPLVMRVVHVLQLEVSSPEPALSGKILLETWSQTQGKDATSSLRLPSRALSLSGSHLPFDEESFKRATEELVKEKLTGLVDPHFRMQRGMEPDAVMANIRIVRSSLGETRHHVQESADYPDLSTLYHIYSVAVEVEGLPTSDFATVDRPLDEVACQYLSLHDGQRAQGFKWLTWQDYAHLLRSQVSDTQIRRVQTRWLCFEQDEGTAGSEAIDGLSQVLERLARRASPEASAPGRDEDLEEAQRLLSSLNQAMSSLKAVRESVFRQAEDTKGIPPSMLTEMKENIIVKPETLRRASEARRDQVQRLASIERLTQAGAIRLSDLGAFEQIAPRGADAGAVLRSVALDPKKLIMVLNTIFPSEGGTASEQTGIPVDALYRLLKNLTPDLTPEAVAEVVETLTQGRGFVETQAFVDWLYQ